MNRNINNIIHLLRHPRRKRGPSRHGWQASGPYALDSNIRTLMMILTGIFLSSPCALFALPAKNPPASQATPSDNIPLLINSDSTQMNFKTGINVYDGHVTATHGKSTLTGDRVITYKNKDNKLEKIFVVGKQAVMHYEEDPNDKPIDAQSDTITDYPLTHIVVFEGNAVATQGKNVIHAPTIQYNTEAKVMQAFSTKENRTHILLYNDQSQTTSKPATSTPSGKKTS